jgi:hypothetical protein
LALAVVFCDIGRSVYYVPGILYVHVKDATPFFVLLTTGGFILLALKYIEISWRNPEGGGVVTITTKLLVRCGDAWAVCYADNGRLFPDHRDLGRFRITVHRQRFPCIGCTYCNPGLRWGGHLGST